MRLETQERELQCTFLTIFNDLILKALKYVSIIFDFDLKETPWRIVSDHLINKNQERERESTEDEQYKIECSSF